MVRPPDEVRQGEARPALDLAFQGHQDVGGILTEVRHLDEALHLAGVLQRVRQKPQGGSPADVRVGLAAARLVPWGERGLSAQEFPYCSQSLLALPQRDAEQSALRIAPVPPDGQVVFPDAREPACRKAGERPEKLALSTQSPGP